MSLYIFLLIVAIIVTIVLVRKRILSGKTALAIGIGVVLMVALARFQIPLGFSGKSFSLDIAVLAFFAAVFGPVAGLLVGFIGSTINFLFGGLFLLQTMSLVGVIVPTTFGLAVGLFWKLYKIEKGEFGLKQCLIFNGIQIASNMVLWSLAFQILFRITFHISWGWGWVDGATSAIVVLIFGSLLAFGYSKFRHKKVVEEELREKEREAEMEKQRLEQEQRDKERIEKYRQAILSGAISFDNEIQQIANKLSKYKSDFKVKAAELQSLVQEFTTKTSTGSWDTYWYDRITNQIMNTSFESPPYDIKTKLSDLSEIKMDPRIKALTDEFDMLNKECRDCNSTIREFRYRMGRMY